MNGGQYEGLLNVLVEIRDRMPEGKTLADPGPDKPAEPVRDDMPNTNRKASAHQALALLLVVLNGWIEGAKSNHQALEHRGENIGSECWREFAPSDIRNMINDVARELGLAEFPLSILPEEEKAL